MGKSYPRREENRVPLQLGGGGVGCGVWVHSLTKHTHTHTLSFSLKEEGWQKEKLQILQIQKIKKKHTWNTPLGANVQKAQVGVGSGQWVVTVWEGAWESEEGDERMRKG